VIVFSVALAVVAVAAFGPDSALLPALGVAAVAPPLVRADLADRRLPNRLVLPALAAGAIGFGLKWIADGHPPLLPVIAGAAYGGALLVLALFGGMGMGDVKLAAALGLASPTLAVAVLSPVLAFGLGGIAAVIVLIRRGPRSTVAFGPFLLAGYFAALAVTAVLRLVG